MVCTTRVQFLAKLAAVMGGCALFPEEPAAATATDPPPTTEPAAASDRPPTDSDEDDVRRANPRPLLKETSLEELLSNGHVALVRNYDTADGVMPGWLQMTYACFGQRLVRRQELPPEALLSKEEFAKEAEDLVSESNYRVGAISHGWLSANHPDPDGARRVQIGNINIPYLFWDFLSLFQSRRSGEEEYSFRLALANMHKVYSNPNWLVCKLVHTPPNAPNPRPYELRGWCVFEAVVSGAAAGIVKTFDTGMEVYTIPSAVPVTPARFNTMIQNYHFTNGRVDADSVAQLYNRIFPKLAQTKKLTVYAWNDAEVTQLISEIDDFRDLKDVQIFNQNPGCTATVSNGKIAELREILTARGGDLKYFYTDDACAPGTWWENTATGTVKK